MRLLLLCVILLTTSLQAEARECKISAPRHRISQEIPSPAFFRCLIAEIRDLKKQQKEFEETLSKYESLLKEIPAPYVNNNGKVTAETDRRIGSAKYILNARQTGGISSLFIEQPVIEELCASQVCQLSLALHVIGVFNNEPLNSTIVGPCSFDYDAASGAWTRGTGCSGESLQGMDGNGAVGIGDRGADVIVEAGEACLLADAGVRKAISSEQDFLARDSSLGLFLIAAPTRRTDGIRRLKCVLEIE